MNFSNTFALLSIMEIGRELRSRGPPPLCNGITLAHFQINGISHVDEDKLNKSHRGYARTREAGLMNLISKPSGPAPLPELRSHITC